MITRANNGAARRVVRMSGQAKTIISEIRPSGARLLNARSIDSKPLTKFDLFVVRELN